MQEVIPPAHCFIKRGSKGSFVFFVAVSGGHKLVMYIFYCSSTMQDLWSLKKLLESTFGVSKFENAMANENIFL